MGRADVRKPGPEGSFGPPALPDAVGTYNQSFSRNYSSESEYGDDPTHASAVLM